MFRIHVARSYHELEQLRPVWTVLERGAATTIFQSYTWNRTAAAVFAGREEPCVILAESDSGAVIIPAAVSRHRQISFLGDVLFDYRDVLSTGDPELERTAWARLAQLGMPLSLVSIRGEQRRDDWSEFSPRFFCHAPEIPVLHTSSDDLAAAHRRLGRFWRRALRSGAELRHYDGTAADLLRWIYRQKAAQLGPGPENLFVDPLRGEFMVAVCAADPSACEMFSLEKDGRVMSALVTFRDRRARRFYTVFYDPDFAAYSPGNILLFEICRRTLQEGLDCDLMTGEQAYKQRLATSTVPLFRVDVSAETLAAVADGRERVGELAA